MLVKLFLEAHATQLVVAVVLQEDGQVLLVVDDRYLVSLRGTLVEIVSIGTFEHMIRCLIRRSLQLKAREIVGLILSS